jgi:hypothetical protein
MVYEFIGLRATIAIHRELEMSFGKTRKPVYIIAQGNGLVQTDVLLDY